MFYNIIYLKKNSKITIYFLLFSIQNLSEGSLLIISTIGSYILANFLSKRQFHSEKQCNPQREFVKMITTHCLRPLSIHRHAERFSAAARRRCRTAALPEAW